MAVLQCTGYWRPVIGQLSSSLACDWLLASPGLVPALTASPSSLGLAVIPLVLRHGHARAHSPLTPGAPSLSLKMEMTQYCNINNIQIKHSHPHIMLPKCIHHQEDEFAKMFIFNYTNRLTTKNVTELAKYLDYLLMSCRYKGFSSSSAVCKT